MAMGDGVASSSGEQQSDTEKLRTQMNTLFKLRVDVNELAADEELTRANNVSDGPTAYFVHSIEGIVAPVRHLCNQLTVSVKCFQSVAGTPFDSIETVAKHYMKLMRADQPVGPYILVGYSYGAVIAFEMACLLDDEGVAHELVLLDSSHHYMATYRKIYRIAYGMPLDVELSDYGIFQTELLIALTNRFANFDENDVRSRLLGLDDWQKRVAEVAKLAMASGLFNESETFVKTCDSLRQKFSAADRYWPTRNLKGNVTLLRVSQGAAKQSDVGHDYGLTPVVDGEVTVHVINGDHDSFVQGSGSRDTAAILNAIFCQS